MSIRLVMMMINRRFHRSAKRLIAVALVTAVLPTSLLSQSTDSLRLDQVVRDVISHNDRIAAARYMEKASQAKIGPAGAWDDPMLMLGVTNLPTSLDLNEDDMTMRMVGLSANIPYAGQKGLQSKAARSEAEASSEDRRAMEVDMVMAARYAYSDLYYRTQTLNDMAAQYELLNVVVASTKARLTTNQAGQEEYLAAQAELWRAQAQLLESEHMVDEARYDLNVMRGLDPAAVVPPLYAPPRDTVPLNADAWLAAAKQNYPPLQKLNRQADAYSFSSAAARRMSWPMLGLSGSYGFRSGLTTSMMPPTKREDMMSFQVTLSLPFFAGRQQRKMASSMDAMRLSVDADAAQKWREVQARILLLHTSAVHLVATIDLYKNHIVAADYDAYQSALAGYSANRIPFTSLLMYAGAVYRDRVALNQFNNDLDRTMAEINSYVVDPKTYTPESSVNNR